MLLRLLRGIAAIGFVISAGLHVGTLLGFRLTGSPRVWLLHAGVLVAWIPVVLLVQRESRGGKLEARSMEQLIFRGCPAPMRWIASAFFLYAILNFALISWLPILGAPATLPATVRELRAFSGFWMGAYALAFAALSGRLNLVR